MPPSLIILLLPELLIFAAMLMLGLALGAVFPPALYSRRPWAAAILNGTGFLLYAWPAWSLSILICSRNAMVHVTTTESILAATLSTGIFLGTEVLCFMRQRRAEKSRR